MVEPLLIVSIFLGFFTTIIILPYWIKQARANGFVGKDMNKPDKKEVVEGGGLAVLSGIAVGILFYIAVNTFVFNKTDGILVPIFALLSVLFIASLVGVVDDLLGWKKGLSRKIRILIILFSAVPLMVINAGASTMSIPFIGSVNFGLLYPLLIIPIGVLGATTTFNFIAGYNGLEAKQGIILLSALGIITYLTGNSWLTILSLIAVASLIGFYIFNKYPAKIFPGDVMTYSVGALFAGIAIVGNIEKIAIFFFIPYIIETGLKLRGGLKKESFGKVNDDGSLDLRYEKIYGLEHLAIWTLKKIKPSKKAYEREVVWMINGFQVLVIVLGFLLFL